MPYAQIICGLWIRLFSFYKAKTKALLAKFSQTTFSLKRRVSNNWTTWIGLLARWGFKTRRSIWPPCIWKIYPILSSNVWMKISDLVATQNAWDKAPTDRKSVV